MEFIMDGKIESITGIYTENTDVTTPNYILKPIKGFTHKHIVQMARLYCRMITGEQFGVMRGDMTIDLETIPLKDVPLNGFFIEERASQLFILYRKRKYYTYKQVAECAIYGIWVGGELVVSRIEPQVAADLVDEEKQVAYTGIILQG